MIRKLTLVAGFGAGYVLGAKAGTQRYDQIVTKFRELAGMPVVQDMTSNLAQTASTLGDKAKATVSDTVSSVSEKVSGASSTDSSTSSVPEPIHPVFGGTPMADAAHTATEPDAPSS